MSPVIQLSRYRAIGRRDIPLDFPEGDSDLLPVALLLWLCSVARVALTLAHRETFAFEATVALSFVVALPLFFLQSRHSRDTARQQSGPKPIREL